MGDTELLAHAFVPVLGEGLGALDAETVKVKVVVVTILAEQALALDRGL